MSNRRIPWLLVTLIVGCGTERTMLPSADAAAPSDLSVTYDEGSAFDANAVDAGNDGAEAPSDASSDSAAFDAGLTTIDAGSDASALDAGRDASYDAGVDMPITCASDERVCRGVCVACPTTGVSTSACSFAGACVARTCAEGYYLMCGECMANSTSPAFASTPSSTIAGPAASIAFGTSLAISHDGNVLVVGDPDFFDAVSDTRPGAVLIYARSGAAFASTPVQTLVETTFGSSFGTSVALSGDASVLAVGDSGIGKVYLFARAGEAFATTPFQTLNERFAYSTFGSAVSFNFDASTLYVGAGGTDSRAGEVYAFERSGASFTTTPSQTLVGPSDSTEFGASIAITEDDATLVVGGGGPHARGVAEHLYVFARAAEGEFPASATQALLTPCEGLDFGSSLAFTRDGATLFVGDTRFGDIGRVYAYARTGAGLDATPFQVLLGALGTSFGTSVAVSPDETRLYVGGVNSVSVFSSP
ncbi:MAG: hypothetical protein IPK60_24795 [Sandaracinaceae bacterium]|jgi:hypothetical protein|nr:hypothetical protein [Sandaracinaceae bacterium]